MLPYHHHHQKVWKWKGLRINPERSPRGYPNQTQMFAGWKQASIEILLRNAIQLLLIFPAVKFIYSSLFPSPEGLSSGHEICGSTTQCVCVYIFTSTHMCTQWLSRVEWCLLELFQWGCLGTRSPSIPTSPTMLPAQGRWREERNHWDPLGKSQGSLLFASLHSLPPHEGEVVQILHLIALQPWGSGK